MPWYDLNEKTEKLSDDKIVNDNIRFDKFMVKNKLIIKSIESVCFSLPKENEQIRLITQKRFNAFALVKWLVDNLSEIDQIILTTYRIDEMTLSGINKILNERNINKLTIVCSAFFTSVKVKEPFAEKLKYLAITDNRVKAVFCHNHTKIIGIKTKDTAYVIEGSGNLTENARIEQYMIENSDEIFEFHKNWINELKETPKKVQIYGN
jgi:hypothetical protein